MFGARVLLLLALVASGARPGAAAGEGSRAIPRQVVAARMKLRQHDTAGALALLEPDRALSPCEPERAWLLAHILHERSEGARARRLAWAMPRSAFRTALVASLDEDPRGALDDVRNALRHVGSPWLDLAAAYLYQVVGEDRAARAHALRAEGRGVTFVDVDALLVIARTYLEDGSLADAARAAAAASRLAPEDVRTYLVGAAAARRDGNAGASAAFLVEALRWVPEAEGYAHSLAELLRHHDDRALAARVESALAGIPRRENPERVALEGWLAGRRGADDEAIARYEQALRSGANPIPVERELRGLLATRGRYARVVELLRAAIPADVREEPANLLRPAWHALDAAVRRAPDASAPEEDRLRLARALTALGALEEAAAVLRPLTRPDARDLARRIEAHLGFVAAIEKLLEGGYRQGDRKEEPPGFPETLAALSRLAREHLPPDEAAAFADPTRGERNVALIGRWLDHSTDTSSPVVAYFRRYGTYLVLGRRTDQPVEAVLLSLGSLTRGQEIRTRGHCFRQDVAVGYDRRLRSFVSSVGGDLGGACLPDGIWMDADSVRAVEHEMRLLPSRDRSWIRIAARAPRLVTPDTPEGTLALGESAGAGARLLLRYLERSGGDRWGSFRTLRAHEFGHLVELRRHLPIRHGLGASLRLLAASRFSLSVAERTLEMRAQLAAVAESPDPDLALAEMVLLLPVYDRDPEPHEAGYQEGVRRLLAHVRSRPDLYPQVDRRYRLLPQLDRLDNEQIRRAARAVLPR